MKIRPCLYAVAILVLAAAPAVAEMYHWVDDNGVNHFANSPPPAGVQAENSWPEMRYDAAADRAQEAENQRIIEKQNASGAVSAEKAQAEASAQKAALLKKTAELQKRRAALAQTILTNRYNFRDQAKVLRRRIKDVDRQIAAAEVNGKDATAIREQRKKLWDELFTSRYVVKQGYAPMKQYQEVVRQLEALKR